MKTSINGIPRSFREYRDRLISELAEQLQLDEKSIDPRDPFSRYGLNSVAMVGFLAGLASALQRPLPPTLAWEYPTIEALARYLADSTAQQAAATPSQAPRVAADEPIAIVGMACRFPGAADPQSFWRLLRDGVDAIREVPADRWNVDALYAADAEAPGKMITRWGGFLDRVDGFDAGFFGISPREAPHLDPQQRLMLELAWEALEDARVAADTLAGSRTGVFLGAVWKDYAALAAGRLDAIEPHTTAGQLNSIIAGRISYTFGFQGPSLVVDTACSSSLVAVHLGCHSLRQGESSLVLAGGVNLILTPDHSVGLSKSGALSPDGRCKTFDARANGYARGEGAGVVLLKRLSDAQAAGDRIYCVIRGSAVNNDGFSNGLTAPNPRAQEQVIREACSAAGILPEQVQYLDAHGTGTPLGDPIEAMAAGAVLGAGRPATQPLRIGSVKTNIGHLEAAAGISGLIKVALAMQHGALPPSLHFEQPNPLIPFAELGLHVQTTLAPWEGEHGRLLAGVSSFGFSGTNCHVVLEGPRGSAPRLFLQAADCDETLQHRAQQLRTQLGREPGHAIDTLCQPMAAEAHERSRLAAVVRSSAELEHKLAAFAAGQKSPGLAYGQTLAPAPRVAWVFGGHGSHWQGMGRALLAEEPVARAALLQCDQALRRYVPWSLHERLLHGDAETFEQIDFVQPAIFAMQIAIAAVWRARGVEPAVIFGQSIGEFAAAYVAGALSLDDAARVVCLCSQQLKQATGRTAIVGLSQAAASERLQRYAGRLYLIGTLAPEQTMVAGDEAALQEFLSTLPADGVFGRQVRVDLAPHCPLLDPVLVGLESALASIQPRPCQIPLYSTVTAGPIAGPELDAGYWVRNLRQPVQMTPVVQQIVEEGIDVFLEVDPHPVLVPALEQGVRSAGRPILVSGSARRDEGEPTTLLEAAARLFVAGVPVHAQAGSATRRERSTALPFVLSAKSEPALCALAARLREHVLAHPEQDLADVAHSLATTRSALSHRISLLAGDRETLLRSLAAAAEQRATTGVVRGQVSRRRDKLAFLFPGQGAQSVGTGRGLYADWPVFRRAFDACAERFAQELERPLPDVMWASPGTADAALLDQTAYTQAAMFTIGYALHALWQSWGIRPELVAGHSVGEIVAACVAGVFSLADAVKLVAARGRLMQALPVGGAMVSIAAPEAQVASEASKQGPEVAIAAVNGPAQTVVSGDEAAVEGVAAIFRSRGVKTKRLAVSHAFHSPRMQPMLEAFADVARSIRYEAPRLLLASNLSGALCRDEVQQPDYWVRHVREAVRFGDGVRALAAAGARTFVELGPGAALVALVPACLPDASAQALASLRPGRDESATLLEAASELWVEGAALSWSGLLADGGARVQLPTYPWQRERYWRDVRSQTSAVDPGESWIYELCWREQPPVQASEPRVAVGSWLVLADRGGFADAVAAQLAAQGQVCTLLPPVADPSERHGQLAQVLAQPLAWRGVIYLWPLDEVAGANDDAEDVLAATLRATSPLPALARALATAAQPPRLWIVTRGACRVAAQASVAVCQSAVWGAGRVLSLEHPAAWGGLIDLDEQPSPLAAQALVAELLGNDSEDLIALRAGRRYVARLAASQPPEAATPIRLSPEASYLVTGGLGALGLRVADWLAQHGARHLVLTSRRGLPAETAAQHERAAEAQACRAAIAALEAQGIRVTVAAVDVADVDQMSALVASIAPPLRGVVHAAGIGPLIPLAKTDAALLEAVLRPKLVGGWLLHRLLADRPLDLFVLFSSGAAVWGGEGQGAYAAANGFLDGLAQLRHARSLPALSIDWGVWAEGGMADRELQARFERIGVLAMPTAPALVALSKLCGAGVAQRTVARMDWARFAPVYAARGRRSLLSELVISAPQARAAEPAPTKATSASWSHMSASEARARLSSQVQATVAEVLGIASAQALDPQRGFAEQGLDSLMAVQLRSRIETALDLPLSATVAFDHPNVEALVTHLLRDVLAIAEQPAVAAVRSADDEPIAIVGAACRFPGDAADLEAYWQLLCAGSVVAREVPESRWHSADYYDADPDAAGRTYVKRGGFLSDVETFDPAFFRISPREALSLDPQQRLLLQVSWEALEHAGQDPAKLRESATGIFIAPGPNEYAQRLSALGEEAIGVHGGTGNLISITAGRLAFFLGTQGPALAVDTACSSSLVALHLGCQSLRSGECERALVGGVNLLLSPDYFITLSRLRALSPDGLCKTFSAQADGYGRAEGCAVVVLKRLSDARRDGDDILALIRGSAVNHDGPSSGLTVPNGPAQQAVLRAALAQAALTPDQIDYVECHGTGTALGDPIEVQALSAVYGAGRPAERPLWLGAAKANLGHLESASGLAGLIKVLLSLAHEQLPAQPALRELNPLLAWDRLKVAVLRQPQPWQRGDRPRRAGLSAFGMSGTNAHVVLEEAPRLPPQSPLPARAAELIVLSAQTPESLRAQAGRLRQHLLRMPELRLADLGFSLVTTRSALSERQALPISSRAELLTVLAQLEQGQPAAGAVTGTAARAVPRPVFVFPGQGSQWLGMGKQLLAQEPSFQAMMTALDQAIQAEAGFSILAELAADESTSQIERIDVVQPLLFAFSVALAALWRSWGITPAAVVGHSMGEVAAAHVAGALSLTDAVAIICRRSRLLRQISGHGEMAMVELSLAQAEAALAEYPQLSVAVSNSPRATVVAGDPAALSQLLSGLSQQGVFCRRVKVSVASHSPQVEPLRDALLAELAPVAPQPLTVPMLSTVNVMALAGPELTASYWVDNLRQPVRFAAAIQALISTGHELFLELSPHPILATAVTEVAQVQARPVTAIGSLRRGQDERLALLGSLGALWVQGCAVSWPALYAGDGVSAQRVPLPTYAFARERYWVNPVPRLSVPAGKVGHWPLAGVRLQMPGSALHHIIAVGTAHQDFLADHVVFGKVVVPGAFHIAVILSIAAEQWPGRPIELLGVEFLSAIALEPDQAVELHAALLPTSDEDHYQFELATSVGTQRKWTVHARGRVQPIDASSPGTQRPVIDAGPSPQRIDQEALLAALSAVQIAWGPRWCCMHEAQVGKDGAVARLQPAFASALDVAPLPPTILDNGFGLSLFDSLLRPGDGTPRLPFAVERLTWWRVPTGAVRCSTTPRSQAPDVSDILLCDADGEAVAEVAGFTVRRAPRDAFLSRESRAASGALYQLSWRESPLRSDVDAAAASWVVVAATGSEIAAALSRAIPTCRIVAPAALADVLAQPAAIRGVVCLWEPASGEDAATTALRVATEGLAVVQALLRHTAVRLWWVTGGAVAVQEGEPVAAGPSSIWGLGRAVMLEHPELACTLVDMGPGVGSVTALVRELSAHDDETQIALRGELRWVARLTRLDAPAAQRPALTRQSTVLITGGLGALGRLVARWLAQQGVQHLLLLGRRGSQTPGAAEAVADLEALGARVTVAAVDVSSRAALADLLQSIPAELPLRGIVHAAVVLHDGVLLEQDADRFARVLAPKVRGAWHLHELTRDLPLDLFVLFSSSAGMLGSAGQGSYAAANTFLDALAAHRRAAGLVGHSLAFGAWSEVGLAAELDALQKSRIRRQGIGWLTPEEGIRLFSEALARPEANVGVIALDQEALRHSFAAAVPAVWRSLLRTPSARGAAVDRGWVSKLAALPAAQRAVAVREAVQADVARVLGLGAASAAPVHRPFSELGLDSLLAIELRNTLGQRLGKTLSATLAFDHPTVDALARWLLDEVLATPDPLPPPAKIPTEATDEPIAILSAGCRYPGGVVDLDSFWRLLDAGGDAIDQVPRSRWDADALYDPDPDAKGKSTSRSGGFLADIDAFDAGFFEISPREAVAMDPQQRLLLETSWEAIERAGLTSAQLMGSQTGVFVGLMSHDYAALAGSHLEAFDGYVSTGTGGSVASGRISYVLGLKGPSLTVDTACSSSLVSVHLACQALRRGECSLALAGGVSLMLTPALFLEFSRLRGMAPDGRCKSFSAAANGAGWAEGCGMLVLKRLSDAQRDGDPILAVIRGSAVNQDGRSNGLTAPNGPSQEAVIRRALQQAGLAPSAINYVECHGTGTLLGDPIEAQALGAVLAEGRPQDQPLVIGSVKSNIGHTQAAAGVAGLLKVVLALQHERIPQSLHAQEPNPHVPWTQLLLSIAQQPVGWPKGPVPRRAGVSSFGISGTNAHVVIEEAPAATAGEPVPARTAELVVLSAKSEAALTAQAAQIAAQIAAHPEQSLGELALSLATRRSAMTHRIAVVTQSQQALQEALQAVAQEQPASAVFRGTTLSAEGQKLVFVFPGQGSQWVGMCRKLLDEEPAFRHALAACDAAIFSEAGFSPLAELAADEDRSQQHRIEVVQPLLFAVSVALAALWRSWGVVPHAVIGHSMGEVAAAHVAGALSLGDAVAIICRRSRLLQRLRGQGEMAVVDLPLAEAQAALAGCQDRLSVAASNSPRTTVLSGDPQVLDEILSRLQARAIFCRRVKVDVASHSPQVDGLRPELEQVLSGLRPQPATLPMWSTVTTEVVQGPELAAAYWADNLRQPVRFAEVVHALAQREHSLFVELSPHPILVPSVEECMRSAGRTGLATGSLRRGQDDRSALLEALGALWVRGCSAQLASVFPAVISRVPLPTYPFQRERHWVEAPDHTTPRRAPSAAGHPLLGESLALATQPRQWLAQTRLDSQQLPWLVDHRVQGAVLFPGAGYLEMALAIGAERFDGAALEVRDVVFAQALALTATGAVTLQLLAKEQASDRLRVQIASRPEGPADVPWTPHSHGTVQRVDRDALPPRVDLPALKARLAATVSGPSIYAALATRGLDYGPAFQGLSTVWRGTAEALGSVSLPAAAGSALAYRVHPVLLDACLQLMAHTLDDSDVAPYVPVALESLRILGSLAGPLFCHARRRPADRGDARRQVADLRVLDASGDPVAEVRGLVVQRLATSDDQAHARGLLELDWELTPLPAAPSGQPLALGRYLLIGSGAGLGAALGSALAAAGHAVERWDEPGRSGSALKTRLGHSFGGHAPTAIVHLGSLDAGRGLDADSVEHALSCGCDSVLALVQAVAALGLRDAPRLWLLTRGAQALAGHEIAVAQAPLLGLGRTIALEHAELRCARIDLDPAQPACELDALLAELHADHDEGEIALRGRERWAARLSPCRAEPTPTQRVIAAAGQPFCLELDETGVLDRLRLRALTRRPPGPGEVEIEVEAAGLNFLDVLLALGVMPNEAGGEPGAPLRLGGECAGTVVTVGEGVHGLSVGDAVMALARGAFATHVTVSATLVLPRPTELSAVAAAALPVAYLTAYYALEHVARLARSERILIHAASGGVGLAAVQWAKHVGAEIFATAGSPEKRAALQALGVKYVSDSRSDRFVADVRAWTGGQGVDVVLNSLSGELIQKSFELLRSHGRFVELGKRDYYADSQLGLRPFLRNLSFSLVDLHSMLRERPERIRALFEDLVDLLRRGVFSPPPIQAHPIDRAAEVFRTMAQAQHQGKLVLTLEHPAAEIEVRQAAVVKPRSDGTYLVAGGLGGLGLSVAEWLAQNGAGQLLLVGRQGAATAEQQAAVAALAAQGVRVKVVAASIADRAQLAAILDECVTSQAPLRGVIHAAAVLDDELLLRQSPARFRAVMAPKILGALHLDALTRQAPLDFFVMYSSAAGLLGSPGQGGYAAANTFLDALAHHRRARGLPALSINWGAFSQVGLAAAQENRGARLASRGIKSLTPQEGLAALERLLGHHRPQVGVIPLDVRQWVEFYPAAASSRMLTRLQQQQARGARQAGDRALLDRLASADAIQRLTLLQEVLLTQAARVLRVPPEKLALDLPLTSAGMDSLMGLELRNRIEATLGITMPATLLWTYPTVGALAQHLADQMQAGDRPSRALDRAEEASAIEAVEEMSEDELVRHIAAKFEEVS